MFRSCTENANPINDVCGESLQKVLLIDDDEMTLAAIGHALEKDECQLFVTADGPDGVALFKEHHPDLVLLDIGLPSMSGTDVLHEIKTFDPRACVMVVSGYSSPDIKALAARYGACEFIEKPIATDALLRRIRTKLQTTIR